MSEVQEIAKLLAREKQRYEFKLLRTIEDKKIITNVLNRTIQELEEKQAILTEQNKQIEKQSKYKEELFASVSHELRTPLHGILGMARLLSKSLTDPDQKNYLDVIYHSADNLMVIINDILSLSKINAGSLSLVSEPFSSGQIFADLEGLMLEKAKEKGLRLAFMISPDVPEWIIGDPTRMLQILLNLLNNSIKFTKAGYVSLTASLDRVENNETFISFEIKDTGIGIPREKIKNIFETFTQVHNSSAQVYEGAGLGLNIVRNLLDLMGGTIEVKSEVEKGSIFKLKIPFQIPDSELISRFTIKQQESEFPKKWQDKDFLLIEDNPANILFTQRTFEIWGVEIDVAENLEQAKLLLSQKEYDCILSDVILPDGNGIDFISYLRYKWTSPNQCTPVIVLTASANKMEEQVAKKLRISSYLSKPFKMPVLIDKMRIAFDEAHEICPQELLKDLPLKKDSEGNFIIPTQKQVRLKKKEKPLAAAPKQPVKKEVPEAEKPKAAKPTNGHSQLIAELTEILVDQLHEMLPIVNDVLNSADYKALRFHAHRIKSTANIVKSERIAHFAKEIEKAVDAGLEGQSLNPLLNGFRTAADNCEAYQLFLSEKQKRA